MPYEIIGDSKKGWFVQKKGTKERFSNKPFKTKKEATAQMQAIILSELRRKKK